MKNALEVIIEPRYERTLLNLAIRGTVGFLLALGVVQEQGDQAPDNCQKKDYYRHIAEPHNLVTNVLFLWSSDLGKKLRDAHTRGAGVFLPRNQRGLRRHTRLN